jgi:lipopolysaccharide/colanic/teichoic acid biosynthesis glycosyltransferase
MYPGSAYFRMRPGITGYWQISDRNACDFRDRVRFDDRYEREMSFRTDAEVLAQTVRVVLKGTGY